MVEPPRIDFGARGLSSDERRHKFSVVGETVPLSDKISQELH